MAKLCMVMVPAGQRAAQRPQRMQISSSLTKIAPTRSPPRRTGASSQRSPAAARRRCAERHDLDAVLRDRRPGSRRRGCTRCPPSGLCLEDGVGPAVQAAAALAARGCLAEALLDLGDADAPLERPRGRLLAGDALVVELAVGSACSTTISTRPSAVGPHGAAQNARRSTAPRACRRPRR